MLVTEQLAAVGIRLAEPDQHRGGQHAHQNRIHPANREGFLGQRTQVPHPLQRHASQPGRHGREKDAAIPYADFPFFSSAGPDGLWGVLAAHDVNQPDSDAKDNLYSFTAHQ